MKIVIDTNVVISGTFFGGNPRRILESVIKGNTTACASLGIIEEYEEVVLEMIRRQQGNLQKNLLTPFLAELAVYESKTQVSV